MPLPLRYQLKAKESGNMIQIPRVYVIFIYQNMYVCVSIYIYTHTYIQDQCEAHLVSSLV